MSRDVTRIDRQGRRRVGSPRRDQRKFSRTADMTHSANVVDRPKRGGIRL